MTRFLSAVMTLLLAAGFISLGRWQWQRAQLKERMLASYTAALTDPSPRDLSRSLADSGFSAASATCPPTVALPRRVSVHGMWLSSPIFLLDNQIRAGRAGVTVFQPLRLDGNEAVVMVELGWLPWEDRRALPALSPLPARFEGNGLLHNWPAAGWRIGIPEAAISSSNNQLALMIRLDCPVASSRIDAPLVDAVFTPDPALPIGYRRSFDPLPNTLPPERHRGYAFQWFALAGATVIVYGVLEWKRRKH